MPVELLSGTPRPEPDAAGWSRKRTMTRNPRKTRNIIDTQTVASGKDIIQAPDGSRDPLDESIGDPDHDRADDDVAEHDQVGVLDERARGARHIRGSRGGPGEEGRCDADEQRGHQNHEGHRGEPRATRSPASSRPGGVRVPHIRISAHARRTRRARSSGTGNLVHRGLAGFTPQWK